jgi:hypothetical protein
LNAVHEEFLAAFKNLPAESQRLLNDHYEIQFRNGTDGDEHIRMDSVNSENGWKEIGPRHKVSTTRTVSHPKDKLITAIHRRVTDYTDIHWESSFNITETGT